MDFAKLYSRFVSLGDDGEFGLLQNEYQIGEDRLLQRAVAPPDALTAGLRSRFDALYQFDNLKPFTPDMVLDEGTGLAFQSEMRSRQTPNGLEFIAREEQRLEIYARERSRIIEMRDQLVSQLDGGRHIFVYKSKAGLNLKRYARMSNALLSLNQDNILLVVESDDAQPAALIRVSDRLYLGTVQAFAPADAPDQIRRGDWNFLVAQMGRLLFLDDSHAIDNLEKVALIEQQAADWAKGIAHELWF